MLTQLTDLIQDVATAGGRPVFLVGAGISAESGIPTFRGEEGYWKVGSRNYRPMELATQQAFGELPRDVWHWYLYRRSVCNAASPNAGHLALVDIERAIGDRFNLVTQNVDGLHLRAGNEKRRVFEIHGNIDYMRCARACCTNLHPVPDAIEAKTRESSVSDEEFALLQCPACGGPSRPHVLWFDEFYDEELFFAQSAMEAAAAADLLIVVGTSGATNLPLQIAALAARRGIPIVDINIEAGVFSEFAEHSDRGIFVEGSAASVLPAIAAAFASC